MSNFDIKSKITSSPEKLTVRKTARNSAPKTLAWWLANTV